MRAAQPPGTGQGTGTPRERQRGEGLLQMAWHLSGVSLLAQERAGERGPKPGCSLVPAEGSGSAQHFSAVGQWGYMEWEPLCQGWGFCLPLPLGTVHSLCFPASRIHSPQLCRPNHPSQKLTAPYPASHIPTPRSPVSLHPAALSGHILLPVVPHPAAPFTHILLPVFPHPASYSRASLILQPVFPYPASLQLCTPQPCISASRSPVSLHLAYLQLCILTSSHPTAPYSHIL